MLAAKDQLCAAYQSALIPFGDNLGMLDADPFTDPGVTETLAKTRMGQRVPTAPMYMFQANMDWLIPVGPVNDLVTTYCADPDARVRYTRDHFSEHLTLDPIGAPGALLWMRDRFAGVPVPSGCSTTDVGSMALDTATWQVWSDLVGVTLAAAFQQPIGAGR